MIDEKQIQELIEKYQGFRNDEYVWHNMPCDEEMKLTHLVKYKMFGKVISDLTNLLKQNQ